MHTNQTNGICERFHKTMKQEFYDTAFIKKIYRSLEELQQDVDLWLLEYNNNRAHSGKYETVHSTVSPKKIIAQF